ncbi:MAG TPA: transglutaminase domain-containing protein [Pseudolabrys sp.]|nr:transglutaminase domain-containing protein [Pseudolabrys sp.]
MSIVAVGGIVALLAYNNVSNAVTDDDVLFANHFLQDAGYADLVADQPAKTFRRQVQTILAVQNAVLLRAAGDDAIALDHTREPKDLYALRSGQCFDRSRTIEKILRRLGYATRHAAVYSTRTTGSDILALLTPEIASHAVTEVKTSRGWMLVDSNVRWIGLTRDGTAIDLDKLQDDPKIAGQKWDARVPDDINGIFRDDFTYVFGLYSRHGHFYPPYMPIPDVNWEEAVYNVTD